MRFSLKITLVAVVFCAMPMAQNLAPPGYADEPIQLFEVSVAPLMASQTRMAQMKGLIKIQVNRVIDANPYPAVAEWQPLTARQKFNVFLHSTYAPSTFLDAGLGALADHFQSRRNPAYEHGMGGWGQHYAVELATSESDVFFQRFLFPTLLKQDPRYYRNPDLPFLKRALYSMSRVVITRTDGGAQTINASRILGGAATRALSNLYVPGEKQGMRPLSNTVAFDLLRDAGMNLVHEFWPDVRRKFLHR